MRRRNLAALVLPLPLLVTSLAEGVAEPLETLVETVTRGSASGLDVLFKKVSEMYCFSLAQASRVILRIEDVPRRAASGSAGQACR